MVEHSADIPAWIALFVGLYSLAGAVGELRSPGLWLRLVEDIERSPATLWLAGLFCLALGATLYLVTPWRPDDWLSVAVSVLGGLIVVEGLFFIAIGESFIGWFKPMVLRPAGLWAGFAAVFGFAAIVVALSRLHTI